MDPAALKARFGGRLVFWGGGIDAQHVLPAALPETVRQHVRRNLEAGNPAADTFSTTSTAASKPAYRRKTSSPCMTRPTSSGFMSRWHCRPRVSARDRT